MKQSILAPVLSSRLLRVGVLTAVASTFVRAGVAEEKLIVLDQVPRYLSKFEVSADGKLYFASGGEYTVFDSQGRVVDHVPAPGAPREIVKLPDGLYIAANAHSVGHIALLRADGTQQKLLVQRGGGVQSLHPDGTGWTAPCGLAVDPDKKLIFTLDTVAAQRGMADPSWSRIAIFDFNGKFVRDIGRWDGNNIKADAEEAKNADRTWYDDIEVDPARERIYVTARSSKKLLAFSYDGKAVGEAAGLGGIAVFADGRVATGAANGKNIQIYDADLKPLQSLEAPAMVQMGRALAEGRMDLEADTSGRLYLNSADSATLFARWSSDFSKVEDYGPRYLRLQADFGDTGKSAGTPVSVKVTVTGRPTPEPNGNWQVLMRPSDGSDLHWRSVSVKYSDGALQFTPPADYNGFYEVAVRFGTGPIDRAAIANDPYLQKTYAFFPPGATKSLAALTASGRRVFLQGEPIDLHLIQRGAGEGAQVQVTLEKDGKAVTSASLKVNGNAAVEIPAAVTARLAPGEYQVRPAAEGYQGYALRLYVATSLMDSPLQRIQYHEFSQSPASVGQPNLADVAERMAFIRNYVAAVQRQGFTRETDRKGWSDSSWKREAAPVNMVDSGFAPPETYGIPTGGGWETEYYLDQMSRYGLRYDTQLIGHCGPVCFVEPDLKDNLPKLQHTAQWLGDFPAFYGFNYNDEMFYGGWSAEYGTQPRDWLKQAQQDKFGGKRADALLYALDTMYSNFNGAVRAANPKARTTATPMWQYPAVEGSYAPTIYKGMDESYSHYLSEGYAIPWYPAHSVEFLKRPGKPMMGVFDNNYSTGGGELYLKNMMQVLGRGVQGVGVEHTTSMATAEGSGDAAGAAAMTVGNRLAKMYGSVFAETPPADEAMILYSYSQDITEKRNNAGTPHWERVLELQGAGLMAGMPMSITYEEDIRAGVLLQNGKPRTPMLFFVGQQAALPADVQGQIKAYQQAGGKVYADADSADFAGATKLTLKTHELNKVYNEGYAADSFQPMAQPILEKLAVDLKAAAGASQAFPMETSDPWIGKSRLNGGAVQYLVLATETGPFPWAAGDVWSTGAMYNKGVFGAYLPKRAEFSFPFKGGVVYDVFDNEIVKPRVAAGRATVDADLTTFPGRLYAIAPAALGAPKLWAQSDGVTARYAARVLDEAGKTIKARVPLRIRLLSGGSVVQEFYRGTNADGTFTDVLNLPVSAGAATLEVTELLGCKATSVSLPGNAKLGALLTDRPDVEIMREAQIGDLLKRAGQEITLVTPAGNTVNAEDVQKLTTALAARGVTLKTESPVSKTPKDGVYLAAGFMPNKGAMGELLRLSDQRGLFDYPLTNNVPGMGRGFVSAVFAPRAYGEDAIALVGGDGAGLSKSIDAFVQWLAKKPEKKDAPAMSDKAPEYAGAPVANTVIAKLRDQAGVRLDGVAVAAQGNRIVVSAKGYLRNLALVEDAGTSAKVVQTQRAGQAPWLQSLYISGDGSRYGASARVVAKAGEALQLFDSASGKQESFAAFGETGRFPHRYAVSEDGNTVLAPGTYGVVCWKRAGNDWKEAWSIDMTSQFSKVDWPLSDVDEYQPQFHAVIPQGADYALIMFADKSPQGWVKPEFPSSTWVAAVNLADGKERWHFDVPVPKTLLFPTLYTSANRKHAVLQVQMGSWGTEKFRLYSLENPTAPVAWDVSAAPATVAIDDKTGHIATAFEDRLIQVRTPDGKLLYNQLWPSQIASLAFSPDGATLYLADEAGEISALNNSGEVQWHANTTVAISLAAGADRLYAACWDGRLRSYDGNGKLRWAVDLTPSLNEKKPMQAVVGLQLENLNQAQRVATTSATVPAGENLLKTGKATLSLGAVAGWMSNGKIDIKAEDLTNGQVDDVKTPWLNLDEVFWDSQSGRQVWAEITFKEPTDVNSLTVYENPNFPNSFPSQAVVLQWDEAVKKWQTAAAGTFLNGAVNTYKLSLKGVTKLRYVPINSYYRNFYTSEIEVR